MGRPGIRGILAAIVLLGTAGARGDDGPKSRAERTDYRETSTYQDVVDFLSAARARSAALTVKTIGKTAAGRAIPLVLAAKPAVASKAEARTAGKLVVYVQANIHGGEVEGKESAQALLRDLSDPKGHPLLDRLVLLVAPVYNIDGNEKWGDGATLRPSQDGPDRIGERTSGEGLDLNRDAIKAQSLETRAVLEHVYNAWDPDVMLDLHTTNGTRHGYALTYSPPLSPNTDPGILAYARDDLAAGSRARVGRATGLKLFDYGNAQGQGEKRGWYTFGDEGRYVTNYAGLRNRVGILSEAASFLPFRARVEATTVFVRDVLQAVADDADKIRALVDAADARARKREPGATVVVRSTPVSRGIEAIPLEVVAPGEKVDHRKAPEVLKDQDLPVYDRFEATKTAPLPAAYLIPAAEADVVALLRRHGVAVGRLKADWQGPADAFRVAEVAASNNRFGGGRQTRLEGAFGPTDGRMPAGSYVVTTAQPLGTLAAVVLEPESLDGAAAWGLLDGALAADAPYPVLKARAPFDAQTDPVP